MVTTEDTSALVPEASYELHGKRVKYLGRGMSGLHWFVWGDRRLGDFADVEVRGWLASGALKACPSK